MSDDHRPLSDLVAQGWEVVGFSSSHNGAQYGYSVLLRRQRNHKILTVWKKQLGRGVGSRELDL